MKSPIVLALTLACASTAHAAEPVIGLLSLPDVFGSGPCDKFAPREVALFSAPDSDEVAGSIRVDKYWTFHAAGNCEGLTVNVHRTGNGSVSEIPTEEYAYEAPAAIVLERRGRWFKLRLADGSAWIRASDRDEYFPLQRLLADGLPHLTESWDGTLSAQPGDAGRVRVPSDPRRRIIGYLVPQFEEVRVVLEPGQDPEEFGRRYRAFSMGSGPGPNGTRILYLDIGTWVQAFEGADRLAPVVARFETNRCDEAVETLGGIPHEVLVFDTGPGWFQVALRGDDWRDAARAWLEDSPVWRFHAVTDETERERLAERAWGREHSSVRVAGFREVAGRLWLDVEVLSHSICNRPEEPAIKARGWIPAHSASGDPIVWFSSRGC